MSISEASTAAVKANSEINSAKQAAAAIDQQNKDTNNTIMMGYVEINKSARTKMAQAARPA